MKRSARAAADPGEDRHVLGRMAGGLWGNLLVRRTAYALALALLTLNLLEFPHQVLNTAKDSSFYVTCEYYAAHHFQFGKEVLQNIGPYGYIHYGYVYGGYLPVQKIVLKTIYRLGLIGLIVWAGRRLPHPALRWCWWASFFIFQPCTWPLEVPGMPDFVRAQEMDWEQDYGYLTVYLAALYLLQKRKGWRFASVSGLLLFYLAFAALTKHTTFVLAACAIGAVVLQKALRREWLAAAGAGVVYVLSLTAHWLMTGQALENFPGFIRGIFAFAAGYNEAMFISGPLLTTLIALGAAAALGLRSAYNCWALKQGLARTLMEACLLFTAWKHCVVLEHFSHVMTFFFPVVCLGILVFYLLLPIESDAPPGAPALPKLHRVATSPWILVTGFGLVLLALARSASFYSEKSAGAGGGYHPGYFINGLKNNFDWIVSPRLQLAKMREEQAKAEAFFSLPDIKAEVGQNRVDFFGNETGWILLNRLKYGCRPMPTAYVAFNGYLAQANEAFYRDGRTMPEYVICNLEGSTGRFVPQIDALALRALMDNYTPFLSERALVLLKKNPLPPRDHLQKELVFEGKALFGSMVHVNALTNQNLWLEAEVRRSLLGKALSFLYKPRLCYLLYHYVGIPTGRGDRFLTQLGRGGCMLTPLIENNSDLLNFYASRMDSKRRIEDFTFYCEPGDRPFFDNEVRVRLYAIPPPTQGIDSPARPL